MQFVNDLLRRRTHAFSVDLIQQRERFDAPGALNMLRQAQLGSPRRRPLTSCGQRHSRTLEKAKFIMAWEEINYRNGAILMVKAPQVRDKTALRSHHGPDIGKHNVFEGPGAQTFLNT